MRLPSLVLLLLVVPGTHAQEPSGGLDSLLAQHRYPLRLSEDGLTGDGARLLLDGSREARVTVVGEDHGVAEVPALVEYLFRELQPHGYRHLALEVAPRLARAMEAAARADTLDALIEAALEAATFFVLDEERRMVDRVVALAEAPGVLWGLDQESHHGAAGALAHLASLVPPDRQPDVWAVWDQEVAVRDDRSARLLVSGDSARFARLWKAAGDHAEARWLVGDLAASADVYGLYFSGQGLASNDRRERLMKQHVAEAWARVPDGDPPRVLVKVGAAHGPRGQKLSGPTFALGNYLSEWAAGRGESTFHVFAMAGEGAYLASPRGPIQGGTGSSELGAPFAAHAFDEGWTLFDLRPLRPALHRGDVSVSASLHDLLWGYDAVVLLTGSTPSSLP